MGARRQAIAKALALAFLNPHALLDTVVIIGGASARLPVADKLVFLLGALSASALWFASLAFGGARLTPILGSLRGALVLDGFVALLLLGTALRLAMDF
jgi:L-lysine exporter family protein LysE/ArgO